MPRLATREESDVRAVLAASMRRRGHSYRRIAGQLGLSVSGAFHAAARGLQLVELMGRMRKEAGPDGSPTADA